MRPRGDIRFWGTTLRMSISIGAIQVINLLYLKVDGVLLSVLAGTAAVGVYAIAYAVVNGASTVPGFLMSGLLPSLVTADADRARALVQRALLVVAVLGALFVGLIATAGDVIVRIISQPRFYEAATPLLVLSIATALGFLNTVFGSTCAIKNVHHGLIAVSIGGLVLNIALNLALIPHYSFVGAAYATLITEAMTLIGVYVHFRRKLGYAVSLVTPMLHGLAIVALAIGLAHLGEPAIRSAALPDLLRFVVSTGTVLAAGAVVVGVSAAGRGLHRRFTRARAPIPSTVRKDALR